MIDNGTKGDAEHFDDQGKVICKECGKTFNSISASHLRHKHEMELKSYKKKYPGAPLTSKTFADRMLAKSRYRDKEKKPNKLKPKVELSDKISNTDTLIISDIPTNEIIVNKIKERSKKPKQEPEPVKYLPPIHQCRQDMFNILNKSHTNLVQNYMIEKFNSTGHLEYGFITDMVDLDTKTIFDFPNTFWHNKDQIFDRLKYNVLKKDGWTVIIIESNLPNIDDIKNVIDIVT
jgi:hypothetical protein